MVARAFSIVILWLVLAPGGVALATTETTPTNTPPPTQFNEYYPDARPLSDCVSSLPKPDCGSEARGGWRQITIFAAIIAALAFIAWRIVRAARRAPA